jgi:hypothetical protein
MVYGGGRLHEAVCYDTIMLVAIALPVCVNTAAPDPRLIKFEWKRLCPTTQ